MKYTIESLKYIFKNFLYIFPFAVLPAICLALSLDEPSMKAVLTSFFTGSPEGSFVEIFCSVSFFNFRSVGVFFAGLAGFCSLVVCVSLLMAVLEKHMRIGKRTFNGIFSKLNDNLVSTFGMCILFFLIYELWALISSALLFLVFMIPSNAVLYILSVLLYFGSQFVLLYLIALIYLWLPCLQITGFRAFEALEYSYQLVAPVKLRVIFEQFISIVLSQILISLCVIFLPQRIWAFIVATLLYLFMILIFCVRMQVVYFDRAQLDRADLKKYYHV